MNAHSPTPTYAELRALALLLVGWEGWPGLDRASDPCRPCCDELLTRVVGDGFEVTFGESTEGPAWAVDLDAFGFAATGAGPTPLAAWNDAVEQWTALLPQTEVECAERGAWSASA